jgi:hypothetical protein
MNIRISDRTQCPCHEVTEACNLPGFTSDAGVYCKILKAECPVDDKDCPLVRDGVIHIIYER